MPGSASAPAAFAKLNRVPAAEIEQLIVGAVPKHLAGNPSNKLEAEAPDLLNDTELISAYVARVDVKPDSAGGGAVHSINSEH